MASHHLLIKERDSDAKAVNALIDASFGPDRHKLTVSTLRQGLKPLGDLSLTAISPQGQLQGAIRFWPISLDAPEATTRALRCVLLGPLAVVPHLQGQGIGKALIKRGLEEATLRSYDLCLLVGDRGLYQSFGFTNATAMGFRLPGWVDPARFQVKELKMGCLKEDFSGAMLCRAREPA